jgi:hypothetical protein
LTCSLVVFIFLTASVTFAAAGAFSVWVEGVSAFAFELTIFFHEHLNADAYENDSHDDKSWDQDKKKCTHDFILL